MSNVKFKSSRDILKASKKYKDQDVADLEYAANLISDGEYGEARRHIGMLDTILREECYEKCTEELTDDLNPKFLFSGIATDLLTKIVNGKIDPKELAWLELRNRGKDVNGLWVGFGEGKCKKPF